MAKKEYPYQILVLNNIKGEKWKDIPALEGYYKVSNFGRIKRLPYEMQYKNGAIYLKEERIIKPMIIKKRNTVKNDFASFLCNRVIFNKVKYNFTLSRLVYSCFVKHLNADDKTVVVICKDGDNFNIKPSNLKLVSISQKQQRIVDTNRFFTPFADLSPENREKQRQALNEALRKPVEQYTLKGKRIKTYSSMAVAEQETGVFATSIGAVAAGKAKTAGGFIWRWKNVKKVYNNSGNKLKSSF
ncbi:MAG: NUMOD4 domain-containing protein [Agriterribacter sp.]